MSREKISHTLYRYVFYPSWEDISDGSKRLLLLLSRFPVGVGGAAHLVKDIAVSSICQSSDDLFELYVDELWRSAFLEIGKPISFDDYRYYLHALTHHFIRAQFQNMADVSSN